MLHNLFGKNVFGCCCTYVSILSCFIHVSVFHLFLCRCSKFFFHFKYFFCCCCHCIILTKGSKCRNLHLLVLCDYYTYRLNWMVYLLYKILHSSTIAYYKIRILYLLVKCYLQKKKKCIVKFLRYSYLF